MDELKMTAAQISALEWQLIGAERIDKQTARVYLAAEALTANALVRLDKREVIDVKTRPLACLIAGEKMPEAVKQGVLVESVFYSETWQRQLEKKGLSA